MTSHVTYGGITSSLTNTIYLPRSRQRAQRKAFSRSAVAAVMLIGLAALSHKMYHHKGQTQNLAASPDLAARNESSGLVAEAQGDLSAVEQDVKDNWVGMSEALFVILAAEIGDKSFFVAIILAMRHDKMAIFIGSSVALAIMAIVSAAFGALIAQIDHAILQWGAAICYLIFGAMMVYDGYIMDEDDGNMKEAREELEKEGLVSGDEADGGEASTEKNGTKSSRSCGEHQGFLSPRGQKLDWWGVCFKCFMLMGAAEIGDRTQIAIIVLCSRHDPIFVCIGSIVGFCLVTAVAIGCGQLLQGHISERVVTLVGGIVFLVFALVSFMEAAKILPTDF